MDMMTRLQRQFSFEKQLFKQKIRYKITFTGFIEIYHVDSLLMYPFDNLKDVKMYHSECDFCCTSCEFYNNFIVTSSLIDWPQYYAGRLSHLTLRASDPCVETKFIGVTPVGRN